MGHYGIDLGSIYSRVACLDDAGHATVLRNERGDENTPSVVFFETSDNVKVGQGAKEFAHISPHLVVGIRKEQMGFDDTWNMHGHVYTIREIAAFILRKLAVDAESGNGQPVTDVVITIPAYFGAAERDKVRQAGQIANLNVINIISEPIAAAIAYGVLNSGQDNRILVYDLGGTFDTTVIVIQNDDIEIVCTDRDSRLGGADWDECLINHLADRFCQEHPDVSSPLEDEQATQQLHQDAENLKKELSSKIRGTLHVRHEGRVASLEVTREKFESLTQDLLERTIEITRRTIETARDKGVYGFDQLLLVGGSAKMPAVMERLSQEFGVTPQLQDPDLAVVKGAALYPVVAQSYTHRSEVLEGGLAEIITATVVTSALLPFVQSLFSKAAEDVYAKLRKFVSKKEQPELEAKLTKKEEIHLVDDFTKTVLELPRDLKVEDERSLERVITALVVGRTATPDASWLRIYRSRADGEWVVAVIESPPSDALVLQNNEYRKDPVPSQLHQRISELEAERKMLRKMIKYLAAEISSEDE